jgi:hypothetical protein
LIIVDACVFVVVHRRAKTTHTLTMQYPGNYGTYVRPALARAEFNYEPREEGELGFEEGDRIWVLEREEGNEWWIGTLADRPSIAGEFPSNFTVIASDDEALEPTAGATSDNDDSSDDDNNNNNNNDADDDDDDDDDDAKASDNEKSEDNINTDNDADEADAVNNNSDNEEDKPEDNNDKDDDDEEKEKDEPVEEEKSVEAAKPVEAKPVVVDDNGRMRVVSDYCG